MQAEGSAAGRHMPRTIGRYRILGRLGKGAMGVVYGAHDDVMERPVAIKVMMADLEEDPETSARFYREARAAGQLVHRNIITIFDMGDEDGRPYIVMELLEGQTLGEYLKRPDAPPIERKIDLMIQICEGLQVAHSHGIFHRDVKPGNLVVREDGVVKILDFGIARLASSSMTASGLIVGTPDYMSPEQARGHDIDQRSDIFSAGGVFYLMLTGRKPFAAPDLPAVLNKVEHQDPLPIRETEAPSALAAVVMKALAKSPSDRYQQCGQMIVDLVRVKRDFELLTKRLIEDARERLTSIQSLLADRRRLYGDLDVVAAQSDEALLDEVAREYPAFDCLFGGAPAAETCHQASVVDLMEEFSRLHERLTGDVAHLRGAAAALEEGTRAADRGDWRTAIDHFDSAANVLPACQRAREESERCRRLLAEQQTADERARAVIDEAQKAATRGEWDTVIALSEKVLAGKSQATEAGALRDRAVRAREAEALERKLEEQHALDRAEALGRAGKYDQAEVEIARARRAQPDSARALAVEEQLQSYRLDAQRASERERLAAQAISTARSAFAGGEREAAIAGLRTFLAQGPRDPNVAAEIDRLDGELRRVQALERREADAAAAEAALQAGDPELALKLAESVLAIDRHQALAQKIRGLATADLRQRADARERAAAAARRLLEAKQFLNQGKYERARGVVRTVLNAHASSAEAAALLARINAEEKRAAAERERLQIARQRARAAAPALEMARAAEAEHDYARAAWTAENALALDLECTEAREILQRARAKLEVQPALSDETVDLSKTRGKNVDPEDTVTIGGQVPAWRRVAEIIRSWSHSARSAKPQAERQRVK